MILKGWMMGGPGHTVYVYAKRFSDNSSDNICKTTPKFGVCCTKNVHM